MTKEEIKNRLKDSLRRYDEILYENECRPELGVMMANHHLKSVVTTIIVEIELEEKRL